MRHDLPPGRSYFGSRSCDRPALLSVTGDIRSGHRRRNTTMRSTSLLLHLSLLVGSAVGLAPQGPWDAFNFAPKSKTVYPAAIRETEGTVTNSELLVNNGGSATLTGQGTFVALDFGVEVNIPLSP
jgi:hypothetical protein